MITTEPNWTGKELDPSKGVNLESNWVQLSSNWVSTNFTGICGSPLSPQLDGVHPYSTESIMFDGINGQPPGLQQTSKVLEEDSIRIEIP